MSQTYITKDGDTVDYIAWKYYGHTDRKTVAQVLEANPGLADRGPILPHSVAVVLPDLVQPAVVTGVKLWT
jgi:phage tail protein X